MKVCKEENCNQPVWSHGHCKLHDRIERPSVYEIKKKVLSTSPKKKVAKKGLKSVNPTGELALFKTIYEERGGRCQITGNHLEFDVNCFAHVLSKGAYPRFRLLADNILLVEKEIHHLYDNSSKEKLLSYNQGAIIIYEMKDKLRYLYYNL